MNLTWHIVKKDLRALKWPLLVWTLLIAAKLGVGVVMLTTASTVNADWMANWFVRMDTFSKILAGLEGVSVVLVAALIHEDLLVGTTAFWMTRPISGARLLRAKIMGIALIFFVLPVVVTLPWWLWCGYGMREIAWAALETVVIQAACVLLGVMAAVVTDGFARFLLWTLVLLFAVPSLSSVVGLHISNLDVKPTPELMMTRIWLAAVIAVMAIVVVAVHQFLSRRTWRSVIMLCTATALIIIAELWWPWDLRIKAKWDAHQASIAEVSARAEQSAEPTGLKFTVEAPRLIARPGVPFERLNQVQMKFNVAGIPAARVLLPQSGYYKLQWADHTIDSGYCWIYNKEDAFRLGARQSLGMPAQAADIEGQQNLTGVITLQTDTLTRAHAEKPGLTVKSVFRLLKFKSTAKLPLEPGARILTESQSERVAQVETMDGQIMVTYVKSRPEFLLADKQTNPFPRTVPPYSVYALVNQSAGKFDIGSTQLMHKSRVASVEISLQVVAYGTRSSGKKNVLPEMWLRNAEFIRQTFIEEARFSHELDAGPFPTETINP